MHTTPPVAHVLATRQIPHRVFRHAGPVASLEQAAQERGQQPSQVVRSILFRLTQTEYAMVLIAGPGQIDWRALRRFLGQSRLSMASEAEVLAVTGYPIGAVSPFGVAHPLRVLVDESILAQDEVSIGSGQRGVTIILQVSDLMHALGDVVVGNFGAPPPPESAVYSATHQEEKNHDQAHQSRD